MYCIYIYIYTNIHIYVYIHMGMGHIVEACVSVFPRTLRRLSYNYGAGGLVISKTQTQTQTV
jgi:hypothetical protein